MTSDNRRLKLDLIANIAQDHKGNGHAGLKPILREIPCSCDATPILILDRGKASPNLGYEDQDVEHETDPGTSQPCL